MQNTGTVATPTTPAPAPPAPPQPQQNKDFNTASLCKYVYRRSAYNTANVANDNFKSDKNVIYFLYILYVKDIYLQWNM